MSKYAEKEQWINEVLDSTKGISRAMPAMGLQNRIASSLQGKRHAEKISLHIGRWAAAAVLLLALNVGSVIYLTEQKKREPQAAGNPFAVALQAESTYNY